MRLWVFCLDLPSLDESSKAVLGRTQVILFLRTGPLFCIASNLNNLWNTIGVMIHRLLQLHDTSEIILIILRLANELPFRQL